MTIKAVFFDIDGTLLTDNRTVSASTIKAINQLKHQGYLVGLATGRGPNFSLPYMASLNLDVAICYNGQYIVDRKTVISSQALPKESLEKLIDYAQLKQRDLSFGTATDMIGSRLLHVGVGKWAYWMVKRLPDITADVLMLGFNHVYRRIRPKTRESMLAKLEQPVYQVVMLASKKETDKLSTRFPKLRFTRSSPFAADVISKGMSKLKGISLVAEKFDFDLGQVMAFGDSDNDYEMIKGVGFGIVMGNGNRRLKQIARHITDSNNEDGIAAALKYFKLVE
ncbi:Cof subfamily protein (haloacid dehalogenase superfamily) [Streptococcus moroccensis]|uniref:Cof subfamily protein (Haloacid dehalogenase superfamily) n=1 Tax=Streptococcus moroccensis TaxID=1451356 RepID=A0ABT9YSP1_9STRE|nr:Cof subfamily protein (haloacid dehalogenase superfamily) [Streptococcus moroccensis]